MSYQVGGYTVFVPRKLEAIDMPKEAAMRFILTAGVNAGARNRPIANSDSVRSGFAGKLAKPPVAQSAAGRWQSGPGSDRSPGSREAAACAAGRRSGRCQDESAAVRHLDQQRPDHPLYRPLPGR